MYNKLRNLWSAFDRLKNVWPFDYEISIAIIKMSGTFQILLLPKKQNSQVIMTKKENIWNCAVSIICIIA